MMRMVTVERRDRGLVEYTSSFMITMDTVTRAHVSQMSCILTWCVTSDSDLKVLALRLVINVNGKKNSFIYVY